MNDFDYFKGQTSAQDQKTDVRVSQTELVDQFLKQLDLAEQEPEQEADTLPDTLTTTLSAMQEQRSAYLSNVQRIEAGLWVGEEEAQLFDELELEAPCASSDTCTSACSTAATPVQTPTVSRGANGERHGRAGWWNARLGYCACDACLPLAWGASFEQPGKHGVTCNVLRLPLALALRISNMLAPHQLCAAASACTAFASLFMSRRAWLLSCPEALLLDGALGHGSCLCAAPACTRTHTRAQSSLFGRHPRALLMAAQSASVFACGYCEFGQLALGGAERRVIQAVAGAGLAGVSSVGFRAVHLFDGSGAYAPMRMPLRLQWRVLALSCGAAHCAAIGVPAAAQGGRCDGGGGVLLCWGSNSCAQCGVCAGECAECTGNMTGIRSCEVGGGAGKAWPRQLEHPQAVHMAGIDGCECVARMVAAGGQHTLVAIERRGLQCVSNNGAHAPAARGMELWAAGDSTRGALGSPPMARRSMSRGLCGVEVVDLRGARVRSLAAGASHSLAVLEPGGVLHAWGRNTYGACGVDVAAMDSEGNVCTPTKVQHCTFAEGQVPSALPAVACVVAGSDHSCTITEDGQLYTCGRADSGQCGHTVAQSFTSSGVSGAYRHMWQTDKRQIRGCGMLTLVPPPDGSSKPWAAQVAAGSSHTVLLDCNGRVFASGSGAHGQCGVGLGPDGRATVQSMHEVHIGARARIVQVACGADHSMVRAADGSLYAWGSNHFGQLGLHRAFHDDVATVDVLQPTQLPRKVLVRAPSTVAAASADVDGCASDGAKFEGVGAVLIALGDDFSFLARIHES